MSNAQEAAVDSKLTSWEYQLIRTKLLGGGTPMTIATEIIAAVKKNFNIDRTHQDILQAIQGISESIPKQITQPPLNNTAQPISLFKKFEDDPPITKKEQNFIGISLPRPKRKTRISYTSSRKIPMRQVTDSRSTWTMQMRLDELEQINDECTHTIDKYDRKLNKKVTAKQLNSVNENVQWFYNQFFYSNYDKKYFKNSSGLQGHEANPMKKIVQHIFPEKIVQCDNNEKQVRISLRDHKKMMKILPKPRLFNDDFIEEQRNDLEIFRNICRQKSRNSNKSNEANQFPVHSIVLALHPMCGHLHTGSILAIYKQNQYMVKFMKPELPTQKILDINMSTEFTQIDNANASRLPNNFTSGNGLNLYGNNISNKNTQGYGNKERGTYNNGVNNENIYSDIVDNVNFDITAFLIKLLTLKSSLVDVLRKANDRRKQQNVVKKQSNQMDEQVDNEKQMTNDESLVIWASTILKKMQPIVQQTIVRFRLRGVNQTNSKPFFNNLTNILANPLKMMSKDFQNSSDQVDQKAALQIKSILTKERQNQVNAAIKNGIAKVQNTTAVGSSQLSMIQSCLGILADLKHQGKGFDVQNNPNLLKFASLTGQGYTEAFNELYQKLFAMLSKIKD